MLVLSSPTHPNTAPPAPLVHLSQFVALEQWHHAIPGPRSRLVRISVQRGGHLECAPQRVRQGGKAGGSAVTLERM